MQELTTQQILQIASVCEYLDVVKSAKNVALNGGDIDHRVGRIIYMERIAVQNRYNLNPSDPTLISTGNYLFSLLKSQPQAQNILNNISAGLPVLTGPTNQSVAVGATAVFSVSVAGTGPFTYQWSMNGVPILGATSSSYSKVNAQLSDSGELFSVAVTNGAGTVVSGSATLTVTSALSGSFYYSPSDPGPALIANTDPFVYQNTFSITHNSPFVIAVPGASTPNMFIVIRVPVGESIKTAWNNGGVNTGLIPDLVWQNLIQFGGFTYYYTRSIFSLDPLNTLTLS